MLMNLSSLKAGTLQALEIVNLQQAKIVKKKDIFLALCAGCFRICFAEFTAFKVFTAAITDLHGELLALFPSGGN